MKYLAYMKKSILIDMTYRFNFISAFINNIVSVLIQYFLLSYINKDNSFRMIPFILFSFVLRACLNNDIIFMINDDYKNGNIIMSMTKPVNYYISLFFEGIAPVLIKMMIFIIPIYLFISISGEQIDFINIIFFIISLIISIIINTLLSYTIGIVSFFTGSSIGLFMLNDSMKLLFSGAFLPLIIYPKILQELSNFLPYRYIYYSPLEIISNKGSIDIWYFIRIIIIQMSFLAFIFLLFYILERHAKKRLVINGG